MPAAPAAALALSDATKITLISLHFTEQLFIGDCLFGNQFAHLAIKKRRRIGLHFWLSLPKKFQHPQLEFSAIFTKLYSHIIILDNGVRYDSPIDFI